MRQFEHDERLMLFSELYKIIVNEVTFVGFKGGDRSTLDPPLRSSSLNAVAQPGFC